MKEDKKVINPDLPKEQNNNNYTISLNTEQPLTYEDGFADGYSRAWQECWDYLRSVIDEMKKSESEDAPR